MMMATTTADTTTTAAAAAAGAGEMGDVVAVATGEEVMDSRAVTLGESLSTKNCGVGALQGVVTSELVSVRERIDTGCRSKINLQLSTYFFTALTNGEFYYYML